MTSVPAVVAAVDAPRDGPLFIYGAGPGGRLVRRALEEAGLACAGFIDARQTGEADGVSIRSPDAFAADHPPDAVVVIVADAVAEIAGALAGLEGVRVFDGLPYLGRVDRFNAAVDLLRDLLGQDGRDRDAAEGLPAAGGVTIPERPVTVRAAPSAPRGRPPRVAVFAKGDPLFVTMALSLRNALRDLGCTAWAGWPTLGPADFERFTRERRPDVVVEINRSRSQLDGAADRVRHVCWVEHMLWCGDAMVGQTETLRHLGSSDLTYLMLPPDLCGIPRSHPVRWRSLWPAVDPALFQPRNAGMRFDLCFVGHMHPPLAPRELDRPMRVAGSPAGRVGDLVGTLSAALADAGRTVSMEALKDMVARSLRDRGIAGDFDDLDQESQHTLADRLYRLVNRRRIADGMVAATPRPCFVGNDGWRRWSDYAPYHHGETFDPRRLAAFYGASRIVVHNAPWPLHFRVFEAMACGAPVMVNRVDREDARRHFFDDFESGAHLIAYDEADFVETARAALAEPARLARIGAAAAARVRERHTYHHRARQLLDDLEGIDQAPSAI